MLFCTCSIVNYIFPQWFNEKFLSFTLSFACEFGEFQFSDWYCLQGYNNLHVLSNVFLLLKCLQTSQIIRVIIKYKLRVLLFFAVVVDVIGLVVFSEFCAASTSRNSKSWYVFQFHGFDSSLGIYIYIYMKPLENKMNFIYIPTYSSRLYQHTIRHSFSLQVPNKFRAIMLFIAINGLG